MKKALVLGASGATGQLLVKLLLEKSVEVIAIVRNVSSLTNVDCSHPNLQIVEADISEISETELDQYLRECETVLSCLGHNLTFKGMFGHPRRLVTDAIEKVVNTIESKNSDNKIKVILMNTIANSNRDIPEKPPLSQRLVIFALRMLLPPHVDNEQAADFLRLKVGQNNKNIEWTAVRPDALIDENQVTHYDITAIPIRNAIFNAGSVSRINVADFMVNLTVDLELWNKWKGKMPVIYSDV